MATAQTRRASCWITYFDAMYEMFYQGSYKAILEEYSTLNHFEKTLVKAMSNPLANAVKFGIFG
jgi:hypothetical protein